MTGCDFPLSDVKHFYKDGECHDAVYHSPSEKNGIKESIYPSVPSYYKLRKFGQSRTRLRPRSKAIKVERTGLFNDFDIDTHGTMLLSLGNTTTVGKGRVTR